MPSPDLEIHFPGLRGTGYEETSPESPNYNCIAWAAADVGHWWQPDPFHIYFWPEGAPRSDDVDSYVAAFATMGYELCGSGVFEAGFQKVAIYRGRDGRPSHMARQLHDGKWTSKLGQDIDISHVSPNDLEGDQYGSLVCVLRRLANR
jgi:hypothetical protein